MTKEKFIRVDRLFKKHVRDTCLVALADAGFVRYRKDCVDWPLRSGFFCWTGLNDGQYADRIEVNPFVGVHVVQLEQLWTALVGQKYPGQYGRSASYAVHMGELPLANEEKAFHFTLTTDVKGEAKRLAQCYVNFGLPYAKSIANYDALLPLLKSRADMLGAYPERVACCLYLMGNVDEAKTFTKGFLKKEPEYFERFAIPFLDKLKKE
jgi:hypothetical protein